MTAGAAGAADQDDTAVDQPVAIEARAQDMGGGTLRAWRRRS